MLITISVLPWFSEAMVPQNPASLLLEEEIPPGSSLRELLGVLADQYPRFKEVIYNPQDDALQPSVVITHNGRLIALSTALDPRQSRGLELPLEDGDRISLIPVYPGG